MKYTYLLYQVKTIAIEVIKKQKKTNNFFSGRRTYFCEIEKINGVNTHDALQANSTTVTGNPFYGYPGLEQPF